MCWRCSAARCPIAVLALAWIGSPTGSPRSSAKSANSARPENRQRWPVKPSNQNPRIRPSTAFSAAWHLQRLNHIDGDKGDVVLLGQRGRLPKAYLGEQLSRQLGRG